MRLKLKGTYSWPVVAVAAGLGLYAAQQFVERLPPNTDVAGLIVSALGFIAGLMGKKHKEVRGDLRHLFEVYEKLGGHGRDIEKLEGQVKAVALRVDDLADVADNHAGHLEALIVVAQLPDRDVARPMLAG